MNAEAAEIAEAFRQWSAAVAHFKWAAGSSGLIAGLQLQTTRKTLVDVSASSARSALIVGVLALVFGSMAIEARRAGSNERAQRARGGVEAPGDVYPFMRVAYPAAFLSMLAEAFVRPAGPSLLVPGLLLFAAAKALKWWAIGSLGRFWTFRVIVVPGSRLVTSGPYNYVRHPNYVAVVGELLGVALMTGARIAGPVATIGFSLLMLRRIGIENRALDAGGLATDDQ